MIICSVAKRTLARESTTATTALEQKRKLTAKPSQSNTPRSKTLVKMEDPRTDWQILGPGWKERWAGNWTMGPDRGTNRATQSAPPNSET